MRQKSKSELLPMERNFTLYLFIDPLTATTEIIPDVPYGSLAPYKDEAFHFLDKLETEPRQEIVNELLVRAGL